MRLGPVLGFRGVTTGAGKSVWCVSILAADATPAPTVTAIGATVSGTTVSGPQVLGTADGATVWRWDLTVPQTTATQAIAYRIGTASATFTVPALNAPLRHAYVSCNGFSSKKLADTTADPFSLWRQMGTQHTAQPFHLLLMGGDQVYADAVFDLPALGDWSHLPRAQKVAMSWTAARQQAAEKFYQKLYLTRWSQLEMAAVFASIPTLMMWDDHDIFDGWGSYDPDLQSCPVYQGIFAAARDAFRMFQLQCAPTERVPGAVGTSDFSFCYEVNDTALWAPDLRSNRNQDQVVAPAAWNDLYARLTLITKKKHLLVLSSIPVVYPNFKAVEAVLGWMPGEQELEDDLKDHWRTASHQAERLRLIHRLLAWAQTNLTRVTILSGDVHVGACGVIESSRTGEESVINQLVSTGVVHPPPQALVAYLLDKLLAGFVDEVDRGVTARMLPFPGTARKLRPSRNWLSLTGDSQSRLWAEWWFEGDRGSTTKVIHPA